MFRTMANFFFFNMQENVIYVIMFATLAVQGFQDFGDLPMQNPDLIGGDMLGLDDISDKSAVVNKNQLWPNGIVPYELDTHLAGFRFNGLFHGAFYYIKKDTCIQFIPRTDEKDYIRIFKGEGCYSHVGRTGGAQPLSLGEGCHWMGTTIHELVHALGFYHEQNRSDRDDYIIIYWENIKEGLDDQFFKLKPDQNDLLNEFDYQSLMLYGEYTFSKQPKVLKTMVAKKEGVILRDVVSKYSLSKSDIARINKLYNCKRF